MRAHVLRGASSAVARPAMSMSMTSIATALSLSSRAAVSEAASEPAVRQPDLLIVTVRAMNLVRRALLWRRAGRVRPLRRKYSAIMLQRWWRAQLARRRWKHAWVAKYSREARDWCRERAAMVAQNKTHLHELQVYRAHDEVYRIRSAVRIQSAVRAFLARRLLHNRRRWIVTVQSVARRWLAMREAQWKREYHLHIEARHRRHRWVQCRERALSLYPTQRQRVLTWATVEKEVTLVTKEMEAELQRFEIAWNRWNDIMTRRILEKPCGAEWVPQMDVTSASTYYLNIHTGKIQSDSPNMLYVLANRKRELPKAEAFFTERMNFLIVYREQLRRAEYDARIQLDDRARVRIAMMNMR